MYTQQQASTFEQSLCWRTSAVSNKSIIIQSLLLKTGFYLCNLEKLLTEQCGELFIMAEYLSFISFINCRASLSEMSVLIQTKLSTAPELSTSKNPTVRKYMNWPVRERSL